jgi:hypothetical protein
MTNIPVINTSLRCAWSHCDIRAEFTTHRDEVVCRNHYFKELEAIRNYLARTGF